MEKKKEYLKIKINGIFDDIFNLIQSIVFFYNN